MTTANDTRPRRSRRNPLARPFAKYTAEGAITQVEHQTPTMKRIRIRCEGLGDRPYAPGQHVRVEINDPFSLYGLVRPAQTLRTYTIWRHLAAEKSFDILAHLYDGDGIGLSWARQVAVGDDVTFWGPMGDFTTRQGPYHLFIGEETAAAAFRPMIESLPESATVYAVLESESAREEVPVPSVDRLCRVHRDGASAVASPRLLEAMGDVDLPEEPGVAYIAGEARAGQLLRDHLMSQRGWPRENITVKPFWTPGKYGLHH